MLNKFIFLIIDLYQKVYFFDLDQIINFSTFLVVGDRIITFVYKVDLNLDIRYGPDFTGLYFILSPLQLSKHFMLASQLG